MRLLHWRVEQAKGAHRTLDLALAASGRYQPSQKPIETEEAAVSTTDSSLQKASEIGCSITRTEHRAITLDQLTDVYETIVSRLVSDGEWAVTRMENQSIVPPFQVNDPTEINLYDVDRHVIRPQTAPPSVAPPIPDRC